MWVGVYGHVSGKLSCWLLLMVMVMLLNVVGKDGWKEAVRRWCTDAMMIEMMAKRVTKG